MPRCGPVFSAHPLQVSPTTFQRQQSKSSREILLFLNSEDKEEIFRISLNKTPISCKQLPVPLISSFWMFSSQSFLDHLWEAVFWVTVHSTPLHMWPWTHCWLLWTTVLWSASTYLTKLVKGFSEIMNVKSLAQYRTWHMVIAKEMSAIISTPAK